MRVLRTGLAFRVALAASIWAAFGFVAPPAVMALGHGNNTLYCLSHGDVMDHGMAMEHGMQGASAKHNDHDDHTKIPGDKSCCSVFCLSAITPASAPSLDRLVVPPVLSPPAVQHLFSRVPKRLDRPPILLLSG
jgi:hypothetical protein